MIAGRNGRFASSTATTPSTWLAKPIAPMSAAVTSPADRSAAMTSTSARSQASASCSAKTSRG
jgi:hypothetical protein